MSQKVYALSLALAAFAPQLAWAADDDGYLEDEPGGKTKKGGKAGSEDPGVVREINRGFYGKANVGGAMYLGAFSPVANAGTYVAIAVGQDFVDTETQSMAWEIGLHQGLHNGVSWDIQGDGANGGCKVAGGTNPCTEGDLRTYTLTANYEISFYPTRRVGIGARVGAGVLYSPLLIEPAAYADEVLGAYGADPGLHNSPKPVVFGGPTVEYYTKLSHFSLGLDVDVFYGIGWDLGLDVSGALKYTF